MNDKKKGVYRQRDPNNKARNMVSFRLRDYQKDRLDAIFPKGERSSLFSALVDDFFETNILDRYVSHASDLSLGTLDTIAIIGNGIDGPDVGKCLVGWLDGTAIPPIKISESALHLYKKVMTLLEQTPGKELIVRDSQKVLDAVRKYHFDDKYTHLQMYRVFRHMAEKGVADREGRKLFVDQINRLVGIEYRPVYGFARISPQLRFAAYLCAQLHLLRQRAPRPGWTALDKAALAAMNQPWIDPETSDLPDLPTDDLEEEY